MRTCSMRMVSVNAWSSAMQRSLTKRLTHGETWAAQVTDPWRGAQRSWCVFGAIAKRARAHLTHTTQNESVPALM